MRQLPALGKHLLLDLAAATAQGDEKLMLLQSGVLLQTVADEHDCSWLELRGCQHGVCSCLQLPPRAGPHPQASAVE